MKTYTNPVYLYFIGDSCTPAKIHYATTFNQFAAVQARWNGRC